MGLGTSSTLLIVFALVLLSFSLQVRIIHCHEKTEEQKKAVTYHEPSAEDEEQRRGRRAAPRTKSSAEDEEQRRGRRAAPRTKSVA